MDNDKIINILLKEAMKAYGKDEIPIGAVVIKNNKIISKAHNTKQKCCNVVNHAEILAITKAEKKLKDWRLNGCTLYVTLEPCNMCKEVIRQSRISQVYYLLPSKFHNEDNKKIDYSLLKNNSAKYEILLKKYFSNKR